MLTIEKAFESKHDTSSTWNGFLATLRNVAAYVYITTGQMCSWADEYLHHDWVNV